MLRLMSCSVLAVILLAPAPAALAAARDQAPRVAPPMQGRPGQAPPAQTPPPQVPPPKADTAPAPRPLGQPVNVRVEFTITDQQGSQAPIKKTVSLMLADRENGMIRSETGTRFGRVQLNVDAEVMILESVLGKILAQVGMSYDLVDQSQEEPRQGPTQIRQSLRTVLEDGKPLVISESADPITDRKVVVEVKATILR